MFLFQSKSIKNDTLLIIPESSIHAVGMLYIWYECVTELRSLISLCMLRSDLSQWDEMRDRVSIPHQ